MAWLFGDKALDDRRALARVGSEVRVEVDGAPTINRVLDALEARYPMLRGTIRLHGTDQRRALLRSFACGTDLSHDSLDAPLPDAVIAGEEPLPVVSAIAGGRGGGPDPTRLRRPPARVHMKLDLKRRLVHC